MKADRSRPALFLAAAIAAVFATAFTAYAGTAHDEPQVLAAQPHGMSVPF
jgi:hypothetical protein